MEQFLLGIFAGGVLLLGGLVMAAKISDIVNDWKSLRETVEKLSARLDSPPPPQRPTQERTISAIRAFLEVADSQDIEEQDELQRVLDDWDKAQGGDSE